MGELWPLLLSAQENIAGIPSAFLEQKKEEIKQRQVTYLYICDTIDILGWDNLCSLCDGIYPLYLWIKVVLYGFCDYMQLHWTWFVYNLAWALI